jgi:hypothetical protein
VIEPCRHCGHEVRLRVIRLNVKRKRGMTHYLQHRGHTSCPATVPFNCTTFKPYPSPPPYEAMIEIWNSLQRASLGAVP